MSNEVPKSNLDLDAEALSKLSQIITFEEAQIPRMLTGETIVTVPQLGVVAQAAANVPDIIIFTRDPRNNIIQTEVIYPETAYVQQFINPPISE